jgi:NADH-quinone oxidoreductase subunit I
LYVPTLVRALCIPLRHLLRNLVAGMRGRALSSFTQPLAEEPALLPVGCLGMPVLVAGDDGAPLCVACGLCAIACPSRCIDVLASDAGGRTAASPERFRIDMARCLFCGLCEEACPEEAIVLSPVMARAHADRGALVHEIEHLLVPADLLEPSLQRVRELTRAIRPDPPQLRVVAGEGGV